MKEQQWIISWLKRTSMWNLLWVSLVLSEIFTLIMNTFMSYIWWGKVSADLILIGTIDAFVVALVVTAVLIIIINAYSNAEKEMEATKSEISAHQEREEVSRWLHDDIGSDLLNIMLLAEMLQEKKTMDGEAVESLGWIGDASRNALNSIRSYLNFADISGPALGDLVGYMRDYGRMLFEKYGIAFAFTDNLGGRTVALPPLKSFSVYLIFKETLTNIIKHAAATEVKVEVSIEQDSLVLAIADNGRGFNPEDRQKTGFGLRSIRYRAETIGGDLHFTTNPGEGTFTRIKVSPSGPAR